MATTPSPAMPIHLFCLSERFPYQPVSSCFLTRYASTLLWNIFLSVGRFCVDPCAGVGSAAGVVVRGNSTGTPSLGPSVCKTYPEPSGSRSRFISNGRRCPINFSLKNIVISLSKHLRISEHYTISVNIIGQCSRHPELVSGFPTYLWMLK